MFVRKIYSLTAEKMNEQLTPSSALLSQNEAAQAIGLLSSVAWANSLENGFFPAIGSWQRLDAEPCSFSAHFLAI
jgi:hypothetical protein